MPPRSIRRPPQRPLFLSTITAATCLFAASCGGGGGGGSSGGSSVGAAGNLVAVMMRVDSTEPNAAHEVIAQTTIRATAEFANVKIAYALVKRADVNASNPDAEVVYFGNTVIARVEAGEKEYRTQFIIPKELRTESDWLVTPVIDYGNAINETNENDNVLTTGFDFPIFNVHTDEADVVMEYVEYEEGMVLTPFEQAAPTNYIDPTTGMPVVSYDVQNADFSATVGLTATGANPVSDLQIFADLIVVEEDANGDLVEIDGAPLLVWDSDSFRNGPNGQLPGDYELELETTIEPGVPNLVQMELLLDELDRGLIDSYLAMGHPTDGFVVVFVLDKSNLVAEYENGNLDDTYTQPRGGGDGDNEIWVRFNVLPAPGGGTGGGGTGGGGTGGGGSGNSVVFTPDDVSQEWKDPLGFVSIGLKADLDARLTGQGPSAMANVSVPFSLFGNSINLVGLEANGNVQPSEFSGTSGDFNLNFKVLDVIVSTKTESLPYMANAGEAAILKSFGKDRSFYGVTLTATANVMFGFNADIELSTDSLAVKVGPTGSIGATASGGLNIGVASAEVKGTLTLLEDTLTANARCDFDPPQNGQLTGNLTFDAVNVLKGPNGKLDLEIGVLTPASVVRKVWGFISGSGGGGLSKTTRNIFKFDTFEKTDTLFNKSETATVTLGQ